MATLCDKNPCIYGSLGVLYSIPEYLESWFPPEVNVAFPIRDKEIRIPDKETASPRGWKFEQERKGFRYGYYVLRDGWTTKFGFWAFSETMEEPLYLESHLAGDLGHKILDWLNEK